MANHFCNNNHNVENYKVIGIERVNGDVKESFWIKKLKTYEPQGLNKKLDRH